MKYERLSVYLSWGVCHRKCLLWHRRETEATGFLLPKLALVKSVFCLLDARGLSVSWRTGQYSVGNRKRGGGASPVSQKGFLGRRTWTVNRHWKVWLSHLGFPFIPAMLRWCICWTGSKCVRILVPGLLQINMRTGKWRFVAVTFFMCRSLGLYIFFNFPEIPSLLIGRPQVSHCHQASTNPLEVCHGLAFFAPNNLVPIQSLKCGWNHNFYQETSIWWIMIMMSTTVKLVSIYHGPNNSLILHGGGCCPRDTGSVWRAYWLSQWKGGCYWHLVGMGGQGRCWTSFNAPNSPHNKNVLAPNAECQGWETLLYSQHLI